MPCDPIRQPRAPWEILEMEEPAVELKAALEWRRICATFRRELQEVAASRSISDLLHLGAAGLARLGRRAAQISLPARDRVRLEDLRQRISAWLWAEPPGEAGAGRLLWQELHDFAHLLCRVRPRPEVKEHDRDLLAQARRELARARPGAQSLPPVVRVLLDGLYGLDDELDHLLERRRATPAELEPLLTRIEEELARPGETVH
ncbi:MAG TPA: hypothetical protein VH394_30650 [Thermoanaerobaculia bacterium]|nr:hypothetical protein [Thermoanaerobaculia bacterium]